MEDSRNRNIDGDQDTSRNWNQSEDGLESQSGKGATHHRGSEGLGGESMGTSSGSQEDMNRTAHSPSDYAAAGQPLEGGDSGRGGSAGTGNTDRSSEGMGGSTLGEGGM